MKETNEILFLSLEFIYCIVLKWIAKSQIKLFIFFLLIYAEYLIIEKNCGA